jgi:uncharacterized membrane protein
VTDPIAERPELAADTLAAPPLNRMVVAVLSLVGFFVSLYMLAFSLGLLGEIICGVGDCATVQASPWAHIGPVPVAGLGVVGYGVLLGVSLFGLQPAGIEAAAVPVLLMSGAVVGVAFSAWLTYLEAFVIHAWCQWCVTSAIVMVLIFFASLPEARRLGGRS